MTKNVLNKKATFSLRVVLGSTSDIRLLICLFSSVAMVSCVSSVSFPSQTSSSWRTTWRTGNRGSRRHAILWSASSSRWWKASRAPPINWPATFRPTSAPTSRTRSRWWWESTEKYLLDYELHRVVSDVQNSTVSIESFLEDVVFERKPRLTDSGGSDWPDGIDIPSGYLRYEQCIPADALLPQPFPCQLNRCIMDLRVETSKA